jgi:hypothetical protein
MSDGSPKKYHLWISPAASAALPKAKVADSETTNGHCCSDSMLRTLMKDARAGLNR